MQTDVFFFFHFLGTAKKNPEQSLKLGHDCTIPHSYQFTTLYRSVGHRVGQTSVVQCVKYTSKYVAKFFHHWLFNKELVKLSYRFTIYIKNQRDATWQYVY